MKYIQVGFILKWRLSDWSKETNKASELENNLEKQWLRDVFQTLLKSSSSNSILVYELAAYIAQTWTNFSNI